MSRKPIEEFKIVNYHTPVCLLSDTRDLEEEFQEVLDALKTSTKKMLKYGEQFTDPRFNIFLNNAEINICIIEKATGKKWEDIK